MELFYGRASGNSARAIFALFEAEAAWEPRLVDWRAGANRREEYLALNPMGKIPVLKDGDVVLWESNAINWYVAEKHPGARLVPQSLARRAAVQRWQFFQAGHVTPACFPIIRATSPHMPESLRVREDSPIVTAARLELARYLPVLETALEGREWLEGDFSLADLAYAPHLSMLADGGFDFAPHPALRAWLSRLLARPAWRKTAELVWARG
jgi:glutathione S-transferase